MFKWRNKKNIRYFVEKSALSGAMQSVHTVNCFKSPEVQIRNVSRLIILFLHENEC